MTITVESAGSSQEWRRTLRLSEAPLVDFGLAGALSPYRADVVAHVAQLASGATLRNVTVRLEASNRNGIQMRGSWSAPHPSTLPHYEQGHGGAGYVDDLPADLVQALLDQCPEAKAVLADIRGA